MEIPYEIAMGALEAVRGTPEAAPTHLLHVNEFSVAPKHTRNRVKEKRGVLADSYRSHILRRWCEWRAVGPLDPRGILFWLEMGLAGSVAPVAEAGPSVAYLSDYTASLTADDLKSATFWFGDPNIKTWVTDYAMCDELILRADVGNENGVEYEASGWSHEFTETTTQVTPSETLGVLLDPMTTQLWLDDTGTSYGITPVTGRVISAELTIPTGVKYKWVAHGDPAVLQNYTITGRMPRQCQLRIVLEVPDTTQVAAFIAGAQWRARVKWTGEAVAAGDSNAWYVQADLFGTMESLEWGAYEEANRTIALTLFGEYDSTNLYDVAISVMHNSAAV